MPDDIKTVLIAGGGGNLGSAVVEAFIASNRFDLFVLSREGSKSTFHDKVKVVRTDYTASSLEEVFKAHSIDAVICALSTHTPPGDTYQLALIDAAKAGGVKRFFPTEFGPDTINPAVLDHQPMMKQKDEALAHLRKVQSDSFTWTGIATGFWFDLCMRMNFMNINVKEKKFTRYDDGTTHFSVTNLPTVGKAIVNILSSAPLFASTANKFVYIHSHHLTQNELFAAVEKVLGGEWTVESVNSEETTRKAREDLASGNYMAAIALTMTLTFGKGYSDFRSKSSSELFGLPKEDLEADLKKLLL